MAKPVARRGPRPFGVALAILACFAIVGASAQAQCGTLRLLAVGDSITKGSIPSEDRNTPYLAFTRAALAAAVGECFDVEATVAAQGGAGITVKRDGRTVPDVALPALRLGGPFDYVSLMVGINDLFLGGRSAATIWESGLKALYDEALASGAHVVGMPPLPTLLVNETDAKDRERRALNELITGYARAHPERVHPLGYGVEWTKEQKAAWIEPDRLHLNEDGHKELGRQVAAAILAAMGPDPCSACSKYNGVPAPPRPRVNALVPPPVGLFAPIGGGGAGNAANAPAAAPAAPAADDDAARAMEDVTQAASGLWDQPATTRYDKDGNPVAPTQGSVAERAMAAPPRRAASAVPAPMPLRAAPTGGGFWGFAERAFG